MLVLGRETGTLAALTSLGCEPLGNLLTLMAHFPVSETGSMSTGLP